MYNGFHKAASGALTQQRILNTISNNMANASTPGFKKDKVTTSTFEELLVYRLGNTDKTNPSALGTLTALRTVDESTTLFTQGGIEATGRALDFAIEGSGFFEIATPTGHVYTRNGSFTLDEEGYLCVQGVGRVNGVLDQIRINSEDFSVTSNGTIIVDGQGIDRLMVVDFENYDSLAKNGDGFFVGTGASVVQDSRIAWRSLEGSNVELLDEMTDMIEATRAFQSLSQFLRTYDQMNEKASEIAKL